MKKLLFAILVLIFPIWVNAQVSPTFSMPSHPRLLFTKGEENQLLKNIQSDSTWLAIHHAVLAVAEARLASQPLERVMEGKRLLHISREALLRLLFWGYAYRTTHDSRYASRAEQELVHLCNFVDWNPSHFLDVAEMLVGVSIGYDWFYDYLSPDTRALIETSIFQKGILPSEDKKFGKFVTRKNNWNQVCEAGIVYGSIAIWETNTQKCADMINRAIQNVPLAMKPYGPDGAYPEGCGYWGYGTSFNVLMLSALEKVFNTDFHLSNIPGFLASADYITHMTSPALNYFNYSDSGTATSYSPALFWFYSKSPQSSTLYNQYQILNIKGIRSFAANQLAPAAIIWGHSYKLTELSSPQERHFLASGINPVCTMRGGWDRGEAFMGIKLGSPSANHAHMDVGSFVFENQGVTWCMDMGADNYFNLENAGVDLWGGKQDGQRWQMFRYHNSNHNTLTFFNQNQIVKGKAEFKDTHFDGRHWYVTSNLTPVYQGQVKYIERAFSLMEGKWGVVEDLIQAIDTITPLKWTIITGTQPNFISPSVVQLKYGNQQCYLRFECNQPFEVKIEDCTPKNDFEYPNKGISAIRLYTNLPPNSNTKVKVFLTPENRPYVYDDIFHF